MYQVAELSASVASKVMAANLVPTVVFSKKENVFKPPPVVSIIWGVN